LGFPAEGPYTPYGGTLGNDEQPEGRWHTDLRITEGSSGGPVFDTNGRLVGIALSGQIGLEGMKTVAPIKHAARLLALANVSLPGGSGMPAAEPVKVFIDDSKLTGPSNAAVNDLKNFIRGLGSELPGVQLIESREVALYTLTLLELRPFGHYYLSLSGTFAKQGEDEQSVTGKCRGRYCVREKDGPERALKDLLQETLLHPVTGFYRQLQIEACPWRSGTLMSFHLRWNGGPGLMEDRFYYEVGEIKSKDEASPNPTGLYVDVMPGTVSRGPGRARARFEKLPDSTPYSIRACEGAQPDGTNEVLMVRMLQRLPEGAARHDAPVLPVPSQ
jgi:hypothetical protein